MKLIISSIFLFTSIPALANGITDWQLGFQEPASGVMQNIFDLHKTLKIPSVSVPDVTQPRTPTPSWR